MKVGVVTSSFPRFRDDPAGTFVYAMAREFARRGVSIEVVAPRCPERTVPFASHDDNIRVFPFKYAWPRRRETLFYGAGTPENLTNPWNWPLVPGAIFGMTYQVAQLASRWDAAISHWLLPASLVTGNACSLPHLSIAHSADIHLLEHLPNRIFWIKKILTTSSRIGFVSRHLRQRFIDLCPHSVRHGASVPLDVTPMGWHGAFGSSTNTNKTTQFGTRGNRSVSTTRPFTVLFLGRLVPIKRVDTLIMAMTHLPPNTRLIVAGDGPQRRHLQRLARANRIDATFTGTVGAAEKTTLFSTADCLVLPSETTPSGRCEGTPVVLLEAMGAGLPVVATWSGGIPGLITHDHTGLLFRPGHSGDLAFTLNRLMNSASLTATLQRNGPKRARQYHWSMLGDRYFKMLCETTDTHHRTAMTK